MSWFTEYKKSLKMPEVEEFFDLFFYRPMAFLLVKIIYPTNITPNQLSVAAIVVGIAAGFFYALGSPAYLTYGAILFMLHNIIDCSDGQLARLKNNGSHMGRIIDGFADYLSTGAVFIGLAIGYHDHGYHIAIWWLLIVLAGLSNLIQSALVDHYTNRFLDYVLQRKSTFEEDFDSFKEEYNAIKGQPNKWRLRFMLGTYFRYSAFQNKLTGRVKGVRLFKATPHDYYKMNKMAVRCWALIGPTSQVTVLIICSLINRFDIFFWIIMGGFNAIAAIMWLTQRNIDKAFKTAS